MACEPRVTNLSGAALDKRMASTRHRERVLMGSGAVLSLAEAAALLPLADSDARQWLVGRGVVRSLAGRSVVRWSDVLDELGRGDDEPSMRPLATLRRVRL
jgi:hypothetical protein